MSKVLVIGNGFDIALGFRSKYSDFINASDGTPNCFWPFREPPTGRFSDCSLHRHFYDYFKANLNDDGQILWMDIEGELLNYVRSKNGSSIDEELAQEDKGSFNKLKRTLQQYMSRVLSIEHKSPDENIIRLLKAIKTNGKFDKVYSFNYTDLRYELMKYGEFAPNELPSIVNIHRTPSDNPFNIVLGINEDPSLPKCYRFLFKTSQTEPNDLIQGMANADEIIFYGISFGEIDFPYFKSLFSHVANQSILASKKYITIFTFGLSGVQAIHDSFYAMGLSLQEIKEKSYFNIINMKNLWLPGYDEDAFEGVINRLASK